MGFLATVTPLAAGRDPIALILVLIPLAVAGFMLYRALIKIGSSTEPTTFGGLLPSYMMLIDAAGPGERSPVIAGKVIAIDFGHQEFDALMFKLPASLLAEVPWEVDAIVAIDWELPQAAVPPADTDESADGASTCRVRIVALAEETVVAERTFTGTRSEPRPTAEIIAWVVSLAGSAAARQAL